MNLIKIIKKLCTPAYVYLVMSMICIIIIMIQNSGNETQFCVGSYSCQVISTSFVFICQFLYTAFWTFVLDAICRRGYTNISWYLLLFPYILFFIIIGFLILADTKKEGFKIPFGKDVNNSDADADDDGDADADGDDDGDADDDGDNYKVKKGSPSKRNFIREAKENTAYYCGKLGEDKCKKTQGCWPSKGGCIGNPKVDWNREYRKRYEKKDNKKKK